MKTVLELIIIFLVVSMFTFLVLKGFAKKRRMNNRINEFLSSHITEEVEIKKEKNNHSLTVFFNPLH